MDAPELDAGLEFYLHAYVDLSTCRPVGFGPTPLPWTAIRDYAEAYGVDDLDEFRAIIVGVDHAILEDYAKRKPVTPDPAGAKP